MRVSGVITSRIEPYQVKHGKKCGGWALIESDGQTFFLRFKDFRGSPRLLRPELRLTFSLAPAMNGGRFQRAVDAEAQP